MWYQWVGIFIFVALLTYCVWSILRQGDDIKKLQDDNKLHRQFAMDFLEWVDGEESHKTRMQLENDACKLLLIDVNKWRLDEHTEIKL